jgi:hypothetical protein
VAAVNFERQTFFADFSLPKGFVIAGYAVAAFQVALFGSDLLIGWPFWRASTMFDASAVFCGAVLGYLTWNTHREFRRRAWKS